MQERSKTVLAIVLCLLAVLSVAWAAYSMYGKPTTPAAQPSAGGGVACTMDAKQCPDGSYVGRQGPKCEFAPCPGLSAGVDATLE